MARLHLVIIAQLLTNRRHFVAGVTNKDSTFVSFSSSKLHGGTYPVSQSQLCMPCLHVQVVHTVPRAPPVSRAILSKMGISYQIIERVFCCVIEPIVFDTTELVIDTCTNSLCIIELTKIFLVQSTVTIRFVLA